MSWEIHNGDALEVLDELAGLPLSAIVMDPPYASGARTEAKKATSGSMVRGAKWNARPIENDQMTTVGFVWLMRQVLLRAVPHLRDGGSVLCFIDWRQWPNLVGAVETCNLRVHSMVVWDKCSYGMGNGFRNQHELILHASKGTPRMFRHDLGDVLRHKRSRRKDHPSPKPEGLMRDLLSAVVEPGDLVLDPFAGGGATIVAAKDMGIDGIGIEARAEHAARAEERLSQGALFSHTK